MSQKDPDKEPQQGFSFAVWRKMLPFARPYKKAVAAVVLLMIFMAAIDISIPLFLSTAVDRFAVPGTTQGLGRFALVYLLVVAVQALSVVVMGRCAMHVEMNMGRDLKRACFVHLQTLDFSYYNQNAVGWILARVMSDTDRISGMVAWAATDLFWSLFYVLGTFVAMLVLNPRLALLVMLVVPVAALLTVLFQSRFLKANREARAANSRITAAWNEGIAGAKTSKTLVIEEENCEDFAVQSQGLYAAMLRANLLNAVFVPVIAFFSSLAVALVLARGGLLTLGGALELGMLSAFISYALSILEPIQQFARVLADFIATQANIERVTGLLDTHSVIEDRPDVVEKYGDTFHPKTENWEPVRGDIEFRNVWFRYPDGTDWVLQNFSLRIPAGTNVALVGETGAGKSTLVNLACRFYEPTQGQVLIDGVDYRERSQLWLHSQLGYVLQSPHLFSGSVRDNIRYGRLNATDAEVEAAAGLVFADRVVQKLEQGYDTDVGEGGDRLSTGEKQLISFARAVLADPPIFVLDEATSSIDTETEALIQQAIAHVLRGRTSFLVAHRLSTIHHADLILVVRDGRIVEQGTHAELMRSEGYYARLYNSMRIDEVTGRS